MKIDKQKQGKRNLASGRRFELKVRKNLESKGWIVSKWMNNVELSYAKGGSADIPMSIKFTTTLGKLIPARQGKFRKTSTGFPDFIAFRLPKGLFNKDLTPSKDLYEIIGVEAKSNGYLNKVEKEKCDWLLKSGVFSKILIASKGEKRGKIEYIEWKSKKK